METCALYELFFGGVDKSLRDFSERAIFETYHGETCEISFSCSLEF